MTQVLHLKKEEIFKLGAYYTPKKYVKIVWEFINPYINKDTVVFDPACGYGDFLEEETIAKKIGNDIDKKAVSIAKSKTDAQFFNVNILKNFNRSIFQIKESERLIVIGNPPYNDITSFAKKGKKNPQFDIDSKIKSRDIGISFLRMLNFLNPDYVCILHPLSYLIKKANFQALREFRNKYRLIDGVVISSKDFYLTSKTSEFPIIIALYENNKDGMDFDYICSFTFKTVEGKSFRISDFDYIGNYIKKYPSGKHKNSDCQLHFYTLRDINALKRNKTFLDYQTQNSICVDLEKLDYYVYVDVFKDFIEKIPYYLGNLDIIIDNNLYKEYKEFFISYALSKRPFLKNYYKNFKIKPFSAQKIEEYFNKILEEKCNENK